MQPRLQKGRTHFVRLIALLLTKGTQCGVQNW